MIPVVLLDEVGLAEISKYNPLKVLHGLLEPSYPKETLDIAVVGISNWALDSSKMNRAVHLSRPEPGIISRINAKQTKLLYHIIRCGGFTANKQSNSRDVPFK